MPALGAHLSDGGDTSNLVVRIRVLVFYLSPHKLR